MKRVGIMAIILIMIGCLLTGCKGNEENDTLTINISNSNYNEFMKALKEEFTHINFEIYSYQGNNSSEFIRSTIVNNDASDIVFTSFMMSDKEQQEYLLDLSGYTFVNTYDIMILNEFDIDGKLYSLPSTVLVRSMAYNKTMFEENGWEKPESHKELVALCKQIRREAPDITPIAMSNILPGFSFTTVTTLAQGDYLSTPAGKTWEEKYMASEASVSEGFSQGLSMVEDLVNAGAFDAEKYLDKWDEDIILGDFADGKAAMMFIWGNQYAVVDLFESSSNEYELMPFYGYREGTETLGIYSSSIWGINKELGKPQNKEKLENAIAVMDWISSAEAQEYLMAGEAEVPTVNDVPADKMAACYSNLWEDCQDSYKAMMLYEGSHCIETVEIKGAQLLSYIRNGKTMKDEYTGEDCTWKYYSSGIDENDIDPKADYTVVFLNGDYPEEVAKSNKVKDTGILMTDACKEYIKKHF